MSETLSTLRVERNRLQRVLTDVFTAMYPVPTGPVGVIDYTDLPAHVASLRDERDRLRAVVDAARGYLEADKALRLRVQNGPAPGELYDAWTDQREVLQAAFAQLDGSEDMGAHDNDTPQ